MLILQDNADEYIKILSLLGPGCSFSQITEPAANLNGDFDDLKDKLSSSIIFARFIEYWVPVEISNLQLEQYCYSIFSKSSELRTFSKNDPMGSLREILISLRKVRYHKT